jgi:hypothetical protein
MTDDTTRIPSTKAIRSGLPSAQGEPKLVAPRRPDILLTSPKKIPLSPPSTMKLKTIIQSFRGKTPPKEVRLVSCPDADREMDSFLMRLQNSDIQKIFVRTDFLMDMAEENVFKFLNSLGTLANLRALVIQSSSRFHIEVIPAQGLLSLRQAPQLRRLVLEDMQITASHKAFISALATAVESHSSLKEIVMTNFFANDWANTGPNVLDPLIWTLATIPNLELLELSGCGSHALCGQDAQLLSSTSLSKLLGKPTLQHLQLSFLELDDQHFEAIASQLRMNESLTNLSLDYHNLNSRGFREMMQAMEYNSSVKTLSLRSLRDIGNDGFAEAMKMLQLNYSIESLSVTASPSQQAQIDLYLRMNRAGRDMLREPSASMSQWVDVIARNSDDIDVVRHLLQEIPGLCNAAALAYKQNAVAIVLTEKT